MVRLGSACDKRQFIEEPCEVKVSSTVLKTSGYREVLAEFNVEQGSHEDNLFGAKALLLNIRDKLRLCAVCQEG